MKKSLVILLAGAFLLLSSCATNGDIDNLQHQIDGLKSGQIATIENQINSINGSITSLQEADREIKGYITTLQNTATELQRSINSINDRIGNLEKELQTSLTNLRTYMETQLSNINTAIENLQEKDKAIEKRIDDLKGYVDTQLKNTKDWVSATFATLEQYQGVVSEIEGVKAGIRSINTAMEQMEARINSKIASDIASAVSGIESELQQQVADITQAYKRAISTAMSEIEAAYTQAIADAISSFETSLKGWVNEQLKGYWTIAETKGKLEELRGNLAKEDESIRGDLDKLSTSLDSAKTELTEGYKAAIKKAIDENNGILDGKIAEAVSGLNSRIDSEVSTINKRLGDLEERVSRLEKYLLSRIQSLSYIPRYDDGASTMWLKTLDDGTIEARDTLEFRVSPVDCADALVEVWESAVSAEAVSVFTRGSQQTVPLPVVSVTGGSGKISVVLDGSPLGEEFFSGKQKMKVVIIISDGNNELTSDYISMLAKEIISSPLTFTSTGETSISLVKVGSPDDVSLEYSLNGGVWTAYTVGDAISLSDGEKVSFRAGADGNTSFGKSFFRDYHKFTITGSGKVAASGDIMSILDREGSLTISSSYCFCRLFDGCTSLTTAPDLPAKTLADDCYSYMFYGCANLTSAPDLPATTLASNCYDGMFGKCAGLTTAPELSVVTLAKECYRAMFHGCTSLTTAPDLPATTLADYCYGGMFSGCTSLITAPELPATTLAKMCYICMFEDCINLTTAPDLPATILAEECYSNMFYGCTSLVTAPELPATTLAKGCYYGMFSGCTSLTTAPVLPATTLAEECYSYMFRGCERLTTAPELTATTLATNCYDRMFYGCYSMTTAPELPAKTLAEGCYNEMFYGCSRLNYIKALFTTTPTDTYTKDWVSGVASTGTFVKSKDATWDVTGVNGVPEGWTILTDGIPEAVDLGLPSGLKWASFNLGASKPEEFGGYYAWGETETKENYTWETYKWCNGSNNTLTKYNTLSVLGIVDNNTTLDPDDDVAHVLLGGSWRIPTDEEWTELRTQCTWTWTTKNGVNGRLVTGLNGNTIFLPAAGILNYTNLSSIGSRGYYWSSSLYGGGNQDCAYEVAFYSEEVYRAGTFRYYGITVRPVLAD